jgi:polysaccharide deacetylase family protein (PEP-CTERM system associated)
VALNVHDRSRDFETMLIHRGPAGAMLIAAVAFNLWLLKSGTPGGILTGISFAAVCLSMSWLLSSGRRDQESPKRTESGPNIVGTIATAPRKQASLKQPLNAFTIDLEDYFHTEVSSRAVKYSEWDKMPSRVENSVHGLLDLLDETNTRATVFVLGWVAQKYPGLIQEVARRGHEIGCHSFRHRMVNKLTPATFLEDTRIAKEAIEDVTGAIVEGYRAPSFSFTPGTEWAFKILEQLDFSYDSSVYPVWHALYANARAPRFPYYLEGTRVLEIPIATWRIGGVNLPVGGGAYLRLLPFRYIRYGLSTVNRKEWQPVTLYVHPWEIDYLQPAIHNGWTSRVRQTWGTRTMEAKLRLLLSTSKFAPINQAYAQTLSIQPTVFTPATQREPTLAQVS